MSTSGLPPVEDNNELPEYQEDEAQDQILQITLSEDNDDTSITNVQFAGENIDVADYGEVFAALVFALKAVEPDTEAIIEAFRSFDNL